jgi:hypothetical protein
MPLARVAFFMQKFSPNLVGSGAILHFIFYTLAPVTHKIYKILFINL